ncbi:MAG: packaged DNA stabilization gp4 family protein [Pseudomonadota bacterium]
MITKGDIVNHAAERLALSGALTSPSPDTNSKMGKLLEIVAANLGAQGYDIGFKLSDDFVNPDLSDDSGIKDWMFKGVSCALAVEACSMLGFPVPPTVLEAREDGLKTIAMNNCVVQPAPYGMPLGSANGRRLFAEDTKEAIGDCVTSITDGDSFLN